MKSLIELKREERANRRITKLQAELASLQTEKMGALESQDAQMPTNQHHTPVYPQAMNNESSDAEILLNSQGIDSLSTAYSSGQCDFVKVQDKYKRGEQVVARWKASSTATSFAQQKIAHHIAKSLPRCPKTNRTNLKSPLFLIHYRVSLLALEQAHQAVRQSAMTQISDINGFLKDCCNWYMWFCRLTSWIFPKAYKNSSILAK